MRDSKRTLQQRRKSAGKQADAEPGVEWVGARVLAPMLLAADGDDPPHADLQRGEIVIWLELPSELIVFSEVLDPKAPTSLRDALLRALKGPTVGSARRPVRIRVADAESAAGLRDAVPDIAVTVAPTPEIDALVDRLMADLLEGGPPPSYFAEGRVAKKSVAAMFRAAAALYSAAPWDVAMDTQVLRLDIPALGVAGACVSIVGAAGESFGLLILPSLERFDALARSAEREIRRGGKLDLGTSVLSLNFDAAEDLPPSMRREITQHGWPVVDALAYPYVEHRERDGLLRPLMERDVQIATACAAAVTRFVALHGTMFDEDEPEPVSETYSDSGVSVILTAPYYDEDSLDAVVQSHAGAAPYQRSEPKISRNDPCPCGSGRKYKKCCLESAALTPGHVPRPSLARALDDALMAELILFQRGRYGGASALAARDFESAETSLQFFMPWLVYVFHIEGRTLADRYLEEHSAVLSLERREFLQAQRGAWMSIWEVLSVDPGRQVTLRDLLSGEERTVQEIRGSRCLGPRDAVLARIVDYRGESIFCGLHPHALPPIAAGEVVGRMRAKLRRRTLIPVERLRDEPLGRFLIARWEDALRAQVKRHAIPPQLQNTDGEDLLPTVDHFVFAASRRTQITGRLGAIPGVEPPDTDGGPFLFLRRGNAIHSDWEMTLIGHAHLSDRELTLETNSIQRADLLRSQIEQACKGLLRQRAREHSQRTIDAPQA